MTEQADTEELETRHEGKRDWSIWFWMLFLVLIVYPLSSGPALKLMEGGVLPKRVISIVYMPIVYLSAYVPVMSKFFDWYFQVWNIKD